MFKFLKNKLSEWTKKIVKDKEETPEEKSEKTPLKEKSKPEKKNIQNKEEFKTPEKKTIDEEERKVSEHVIQDIKKEIEKKHKEETQKKKEEEKKGFFEKIKEKFTTIKISDEEFKNYAGELEMILLENNVALKVVDKIVQNLKQKLTEKEIPKKEIEKFVAGSLKGIITDVLIEPPNILAQIQKKSEPYVILFCGINGTGKTTTIAKVADMLKKKKISSVIAAGDTFRAASIEQIKMHGEKLGIKVIAHDYGVDPASVGFDAIQYARKNGIKVVLIDTAGRMHTAKNLLREMEKIVKVCKPDLKIFIGESTTGNDAVEQVESFNETIGIDGIILSKADIDEKGGTALSVGYVTKKPILFLGTGQGYGNLELFEKKKFIEKLGL